MISKEEFVFKYMCALAPNGQSVEMDIDTALEAYEKFTYQMTIVEPASKAPPLDGKVRGLLFKNKDNTPIPADEFVVFRPADNAFYAVLPVYLAMCATYGAAPEQIAAVKHLIEKVEIWRKNHPERLKAPDCAPGEIPSGW